MLTIIVLVVIGWMIGFGYIGFLVGEPKGRALAGMYLGGLLGFIGVLIVFMLEPLPGSSVERRRTTGTSTASELERLAALHDQGHLSAKEFARAKGKLLGS